MLPAIGLTFRGLPRSTGVECLAREVGERLREGAEQAGACRITLVGAVDTAGTVAYSAKIHLSLPGAQLHADSENHPGGGHADIGAALRCAYDDARRQIDSFRRRLPPAL